jgi:catechol 2,3-dioxygenase-like lactoylglutathione lyase family enzyme
MIKQLDHFVITTNHLQECFDFYSALGFTPNIKNGRYELRCGTFKINVHISGVELSPHAENVMPGSADFCLEVDDDLDIILRNLKGKGVPIAKGKCAKFGFRGEMTSIYLRDPDGNLVELSSYAQAKRQE